MTFFKISALILVYFVSRAVMTESHSFNQKSHRESISRD